MAVRKVGMPPPVGNTTPEIVSLVVAPVAAIIQAVALMVGPCAPCAPPTAETLANGSLPSGQCATGTTRIHSDTTPPGSSLISDAWRPGLRTTKRPANEKTLGSKPKP